MVQRPPPCKKPTEMRDVVDDLHRLMERAENLRVALVWQLEENAALRRQLSAIVDQRLESAKRIQGMLLRQMDRACACSEPEQRKAG